MCNLLEKQLIIKVNHVTGEVSVDNPYDMSIFETLGAIEVAKLIITQQFLEE